MLCPRGSGGVWCGGKVKIGRFSFFDLSQLPPLSFTSLHLFISLFLRLVLCFCAFHLILSLSPFLILPVSFPNFHFLSFPTVPLLFSPAFVVAPLRERFRKGGTVYPNASDPDDLQLSFRGARGWQLETSSFPQAASFLLFFFPLQPLRFSAPSPACEPSAPSEPPTLSNHEHLDLPAVAYLQFAFAHILFVSFLSSTVPIT